MDKKIDELAQVLKDFKEELGKNVNMSYDAQPNMAKDEPHKDDPHHEAKEKKIASKIKSEAQDLADMHKEELMCSANGQWSLKKKHVGFKALESKLEHEGHSEKSAGNIAYAIGAKKYGKAGMADKAHKGESPEQEEKEVEKILNEKKK